MVFDAHDHAGSRYKKLIEEYERLRRDKARLDSIFQRKRDQVMAKEGWANFPCRPKKFVPQKWVATKTGYIRVNAF